jgi:hypothetical protein
VIVFIGRLRQQSDRRLERAASAALFSACFGGAAQQV